MRIPSAHSHGISILAAGRGPGQKRAAGRAGQPSVRCAVQRSAWAQQQQQQSRRQTQASCPPPTHTHILTYSRPARPPAGPCTVPALRPASVSLDHLCNTNATGSSPSRVLDRAVNQDAAAPCTLLGHGMVQLPHARWRPQQQGRCSPPVRICSRRRQSRVCQAACWGQQSDGRPARRAASLPAEPSAAEPQSQRAAPARTQHET